MACCSQSGRFSARTVRAPTGAGTCLPRFHACYRACVAYRLAWEAFRIAAVSGAPGLSGWLAKAEARRHPKSDPDDEMMVVDFGAARYLGP